MNANDNASRRISGKITEDPLKSAPMGAKIHFTPKLFTSDAAEGLNSINNWEFFEGTLISLHFGNPFNQRVLGSGVIVAPGVALVASHVVEPEMEAVMSGDGFICTGIAPWGLMIWHVRHVVVVPNTDISLVTLEYASPLPDYFRQAAITTRLPKLGERIFIAGLRNESDVIETEPEVLNMRMFVGSGVVTARHELFRDRVMLRWPTIEVSCPAIGGMSGGPAFDESGHLVGLVCSSLETDSGGMSYISLLWPALGSRVTPPWPPGIYPNPISLLEMDRRLCGIDRPDAIQVERDDNTGNSNTKYRVWE